MRTLEDLYKVLGDRNITICRELTKKYETAYRTTFRDALEHYHEEEPKGECVIVIEGKHLEELRKEQISRWEEMEIQEHLAFYTDQGMDRKEAMKQWPGTGESQSGMCTSSFCDGDADNMG